MPALKEYELELDSSLWSMTPGEFPSDILFHMEQAFGGHTPPVVVRTAPVRETRFGTVQISKGKAEVCFYFQWDDPDQWIDDLNDLMGDQLTESEQAFAVDRVSDWFSDANWAISRELAANDLDELLEKIDSVETDLLETERHQVKDFALELDRIADQIRKQRLEDQPLKD